MKIDSRFMFKTMRAYKYLLSGDNIYLDTYELEIKYFVSNLKYILLN